MRLGQRLGREVLRLDVDQALGSQDGALEQRLNLADDLPARGPLGAADGHALTPERQPERADLALRRVRSRRRRARVTVARRFGPGQRRRGREASGHAPAVQEHLLERTYHRTLERHLDVMERLVRAPVDVDTRRIVLGVVARVPTRVTEIEAAEEGDGAVDDDELLMVTAARLGVVQELEMHA